MRKRLPLLLLLVLLLVSGGGVALWRSGLLARSSTHQPGAGKDIGATYLDGQKQNARVGDKSSAMDGQGYGHRNHNHSVDGSISATTSSKHSPAVKDSGDGRTDAVAGLTGKDAPSSSRPGPDDPVNVETPAAEEAGSAMLTGLIVDERGLPYEGAVAVVFLDRLNERQSVPAGEDGLFSVADLPSGKSLQIAGVKLDQGLKYFGPLQAIHLTPGANKLDSPLMVPRDRRVRGRVVIAGSGEPVAGAVMAVHGVDSPSDKYGSLAGWVRSQDDGSFTSGHLLQPGPYRIEVNKQGVLPATLTNVAENAEVLIELDEGVILSGLVLEAETKNPVAGAKIECRWTIEPNLKFMTEALTDAEGRFAVRCRSGSVNNRLYVRAPGFTESIRENVRADAKDLLFELRRTDNCVFRGRVPASARISWVTALNPQKGGNKVIVSVLSDESRAFAVEVALDTRELRIVTTTPKGARVITVSVTPVAHGDIDLGELALLDGVTVSGTVREAGGDKKPVSGVTVECSGWLATTSSNGKFSILNLQPPLILTVNSPGYEPVKVELVVPQGQTEITHDIYLHPARHTLPVRAVDVSGAALEGVRVKLVYVAREATTDAKGEAVLRQLPAGNFKTTFEKPGYVPLMRDIPSTPAENPTEFNVVTLQRGAGVTGRLTSQDKPLPAGTLVEVRTVDKLATTGRLDEQGRFATDNLSPGQYFIGVPDFYLAPRPVTVGSEGAQFNFDLGPLCHVRGRILRHDGTGHGSAGVYVYERSQCSYVTTFYTDPEGRYEVKNLRSGHYVFCVLKTQADAAAQFSVEVALGAPGEVARDITLPKAVGVITGRVTYPDGAPCGDARVAVMNLSANFERALLSAYVMTDGQGYFRAERMENGAMMLARVGGYADGAESATAFSQVVQVGNDGTPVTADIVVAREAGRITGRLTRADGGPLGGNCLLYLVDSSARISGLYFAGSDGTFDARDVPPGAFRLLATGPGLKRREITVQAQGDETKVGDIVMTLAD